MSLLSLNDVQLNYGPQVLLDRVQLAIEPGERLCLVGRNGAGKSTLMRLIMGEVQPDGGRVTRRDGLRLAMLEQAVPEATAGSVYDVVAAGLGEVGALVQEYHHLVRAMESGGDDALVRALERCQHALEAAGGWMLEQRVNQVLGRLGLEGESDFPTLSGGMKRRVLLARALVTQPDLLLLDEPTNHLDVASIQWLEEFLLGFSGSLLFITHDRAFLRRLATRIVELDRGRLQSWPGDYENFLRRKLEALEIEERENALFDRKLAQEEAWIRQGIKARRTRNEGRVRALKALRVERAQRRERQSVARLQTQVAAPSGRIALEARDLCLSYAGQPVIDHFSTLILRGDKVGIIGPNGAGKTTLLKLLLGQLKPDSGEMHLGTNLEVAYFDQHRAALDENASVADNVAEGRDQISIGGQTRHVLSYLQDFLFEPARARQPVRALSGGERNRLLLARLFTRPANMLVLDEPTNDLDAETLEVIEERLVEFTGTVLVVSHDRDFLDNVVGSVIAYESPGHFVEYVGGYSDWLRQRPAAPETSTGASGTPERRPKAAARDEAPSVKPASRPRAVRLSFKDQRELDALPGRIEALENTVAELQRRMAEPDFYRRSGSEIADSQAELARVQAELEQVYARWEALEGMS